MTTVMYESAHKRAVSHMTRDGDLTICKKKCSTWPFAVKEGTKVEHCKKCWARFNG